MAPKRKLKGAQAHLFAKVCEHYIEAAESQCNDQPNEIPLFSKLSPHQRIHLVKEVMVGVLCEDEPLPPNTIQHNATLCAIVEILFTEIEIEIDTQNEWGDVGEDILNYDQERINLTSNVSEKEIDQKKFERDLIEYRAERNLDKMKRNKDVGEFRVEEKESYDGILNGMPLEERVQIINDVLYSGDPISPEERNSFRPLTDNEKHSFRWRRLCDAALQEDFTSLFPLARIDFDWRCQNRKKWYQAISLMFDSYFIKYRNSTERALIKGPINARAYADKNELPRIRAIENNVNILRKVYERSWDPNKMSFDQRCIFAVTSNEKYYGKGHGVWCDGFISKIEAQAIDFYEECAGSYQKRLDTFRNTIDDYPEGMEEPYGKYHDMGCNHPKEWRQYGGFNGFSQFDGVHCFGPGEPYYICGELHSPGCCLETENLKECSRCKVAMYCSRECQRKHWPTHKKHCANLAAERKNKKKIAEMAKK